MRRTRSEDEALMFVAQSTALRFVIDEYVPSRFRQAARDDAMAIALGIVGGCCGPMPTPKETP